MLRKALQSLACLATALPLAVPARAQAPAPAPAARASAAQSEARERCRLHEPPRELFEVVRVVDGDTLHVRVAGEIEKLRLCSVDTEERFAVESDSPTKPSTVFGEECALWARRYFAELAGDQRAARVGLFFPDGEQSRDAYGRLLAHVVLPDGTDFNLYLVEAGKSPYFNKYGNSHWRHADFVAAQSRARAAHLGIWDPATNRPRTPGAPSAARPYTQLLPWWEARARAVDAFRAALARGEALDAEDPAALESARRSSSTARAFGCLERTFEERDGSLTLLMRAAEGRPALRAHVPRGARPLFADLALERRSDTHMRQNYLWIRGRVVEDERGYAIVCGERSALELAGPDP